jgi:low temperature requirement protein LtrA
MTPRHVSLLRKRDGNEAHVSYAELFFDLVYVFAVTQLAHRLGGDLSAMSIVQTLVLWFAVWLGWQYTCWVTNWFDPETMPIRLMILAIMLLGLVMSSAIPEAFGPRGLIFALAYAAIQVGRTLFILLQLGPHHALKPNFRRMFIWLCVSAAFWIAGGLADGPMRLALWIVAVACEYLSPMIGLWLPGLGRSRTSEWTIEGGHMAERCQLFVIVALGESILNTGTSLDHTALWNPPILIAFLVAFLGSVAMWWVYFDTSSNDGREAIVHFSDPGRMGAHFHYVHVIIVGGVIASAVGNEMAIAHPAQHIVAGHLAILVGGPAIYLFGNAIYKKIVYGHLPLSHLAGLAALAVLMPLGLLTDQLMVSGLATLVLLVVAGWSSVSRRRTLQA